MSDTIPPELVLHPDPYFNALGKGVCWLLENQEFGMRFQGAQITANIMNAKQMAARRGEIGQIQGIEEAEENARKLGLEADKIFGLRKAINPLAEPMQPFQVVAGIDPGVGRANG